MVNARVRIITLLAALGFLVAWTGLPAPCAAQGYGCQAAPGQVYNSPNYYSQPSSGGYYAAAPAAYPYKKKHRHKHKRKHKAKYYYYQ